MVESRQKQKLTLSVDSEIVESAKKDPDINISDITEKVLRAFTTSSKTADKEKLYEMYQELFNLMLPLLKKFRVNVQVGSEEVWSEPDEDADPEDLEPIYDDEGQKVGYENRFPSDVFRIHLGSDGRLSHDVEGIKDIKDIDINMFYRPQQIVDGFLSSVLEGAEYRKNQFKEIEIAKTIIDAITKGTISKSKKSKRGKRR